MDENKIKSEEEKKTSEAGKEHQMKETEKAEKKEISKLKGEVKKLTGELEAKAKACDELNDKYLRMMAEYDNFRKRSQKEREGVYASAYEEALKELLDRQKKNA